MLALFLFLTANVLCSFASSRFRKIGLLIFLIIAALLLILTILCKWAHKSKQKVFVDLFLCAFFCFLAFLSSHNFFDKTLTVLENQTEEVTIVAEISECTYSASYSTVYTARVESINGKTENFSI